MTRVDLVMPEKSRGYRFA